MARYQMIMFSEESFLWDGELEDILGEMHSREQGRQSNVLKSRDESRRMFLRCASGQLLNLDAVARIIKDE